MNITWFQKLVYVYKYKTCDLPDYQSHGFPNSVDEMNSYNLTCNNFSILARRTQLFSNSYMPSATTLWNSLDSDIKDSFSLSIFKYRVKEKK